MNTVAYWQVRIRDPLDRVNSLFFYNVDLINVIESTPALQQWKVSWGIKVAWVSIQNCWAELCILSVYIPYAQVYNSRSVTLDHSGHHPSSLLINWLTFKQTYQSVQQSAPKQKQIFTALQPPSISKWKKKITTLEGSVIYCSSFFLPFNLHCIKLPFSGRSSEMSPWCSCQKWEQF